jgi:A/G-specific adenine glycosylase
VTNIATGLLAGLYEFPTLPDVSPTISASAQGQTPSRLLSSILAVPVQPASFVAKTDADRETLRITKIQSVGDVLHIFSHIRKTYRVQWVVLEGGRNGQPPALAPNPEAVTTLHTKKVKDRSSAPSPTGRSAAHTNKATRDSERTASWATWVLLGDIAKAK